MFVTLLYIYVLKIRVINISVLKFLFDEKYFVDNETVLLASRLSSQNYTLCTTKAVRLAVIMKKDPMLNIKQDCKEMK
jgi:hypothetical protein